MSYYILMGMGLNLEVGLAGLLDLGFVAFFAVGAHHHRHTDCRQPSALASYTLPSLSIGLPCLSLSLASIVVGVLFGIPVLRCTVACSRDGPWRDRARRRAIDMAAPLLGGAQGMPSKPRIGGYELAILCNCI